MARGPSYGLSKCIGYDLLASRAFCCNGRAADDVIEAVTAIERSNSPRELYVDFMSERQGGKPRQSFHAVFLGVCFVSLQSWRSERLFGLNIGVDRFSPPFFFPFVPCHTGGRAHPVYLITLRLLSLPILPRGIIESRFQRLQVSPPAEFSSLHTRVVS